MATATNSPRGSPTPAAPAPAQMLEGNMAPQETKPAKLHGRAFYESIGSPKFVLAPMVGQSEFAWRMLSRSYMTPTSNKSLLAYTPMLHARLFSETEKFRTNHFQALRSGLPPPDSAAPPDPADIYLDGNASFDRPLFVQFCANEPADLLEAARYVAPFCDAVDLNLGCPQGIAKKGSYGAFLQEDPELIYRLIHTLHTELGVPVTAKIRVLETRAATLAYARKVLSAGASVLTVHGRVREAKGHKTGLADWAAIRHLRDNLPPDTVIFANGNILCRADIERCLAATGADAVMSAEGNLYDPAIFAEAPLVGEEGAVYWRGRDGKGGFRMDEAMRRYLDIIYTHVLEQPAPARKPLYVPRRASVDADENEGPPRKRARLDAKSGVEAAQAVMEKADVARAEAAKEAAEKQKQAKGGKAKRERRERTSNPNLVAMQPHCFHLLRALVSAHHPVRDALARCRAGDVAAYEEVLGMVEEVVERGIREYEESGGESWHAAEAGGENVLSAVGYQGLEPAAEEPAGEVTADYETSVQAVRECRRPWWVCQPYVRPLPMEAVAKGSLTLSKKELAKLGGEEREAAVGKGARRNDERQREGTKEAVEVEVEVKEGCVSWTPMGVVGEEKVAAAGKENGVAL